MYASTLIQLRAKRRRFRERFCGTQYRPLRVEAAELEAFFDLAPGTIENAVERIRRYNHAIVGQIVDQARGLIEKKGQIVFDPAMRNPIRYVAIYA